MVIVAPFYGEFGWEVAMWIPWLRWLREHKHRGEFIVMCRPGHKQLYQGFASSTVEASPPSAIVKSDCNNAWLDSHGRLHPADYAKLVAHLLRRNVILTRGFVHPLDLPFTWSEGEAPMLVNGKHVIFATTESPSYPLTIGVHGRSCDQKQPERNWCRESFDLCVKGFAELGYEVTTFGHPSMSLDSKHADTDLRGAPMEQVMLAMARCVAVVGPSSGPLHLANYCSTPVIWWSGNKKDVHRYSVGWNPFKLPNRQVESLWTPSPESIVAEVRKLKEQA